MLIDEVVSFVSESRVIGRFFIRSILITLVKEMHTKER